MGDYISPFDIKTILFDYFLGGTELIMFALVILISFVSAKYKMSNRNFMMILMVCSLIMAGYMGQAIYIIVLVVIGFVTFKSLSRAFV